MTRIRTKNPYLVGDVGIGTENPDASLDVVGSGNFSESITAGTSVDAGTTISAGTSVTTPLVKAADANGLNLQDDGGSGIFVQNGGNVGIAKSDPAYTLDVVGSGNFSEGLYVDGHSVLTGSVDNLGKWNESAGSKIYYDAGNVGVSTSDPVYTLDVVDSGNFSAGLYVDGNSVLTGSAADLGKWDEAADSKIYYNAGNVGVGTSDPVYTLDVVDSGNFSAGLYVDGNTVLTGSASDLGKWDEAADSKIYYNAGNVGIGTNDPVYTLDVVDSGNFSAGLYVDGNAVVTGNPEKWSDGVEANEIYYNAGNVGIATSNPATSFDVGGSFQISADGKVGEVSPSNNNVIQWNGSKWVPATPVTNNFTINNKFSPFGLGTYARVLDVAFGDTRLEGFHGGFTDGRYGYFVPYYNGSSLSGHTVRVDLDNFTDFDVLDLSNLTLNNETRGFKGGFTDGRYGYFVPHRTKITSSSEYHGNIARVDLSNFSRTGITRLNLADTDPDLKGFHGGFTDGRYGYFVPHDNGSRFGKIARVDLSDFSTVDVLDLTDTDTDLKGFIGGFTDGRYGYFVPYNNGSSPFGKIARVDLSDFSSVDVLDLTDTDTDLKGFHGGFTDGRYGYFVPYDNGSRFGKIARVDLSDFSTVDVLDLTDTDTDLKGFHGGFTDGRYGYFVPYDNGIINILNSRFGKIARVDLSDFSTVDVLDLTNTHTALKGYVGGFTDGRHGYFVPYDNGVAHGKIARIQLFNAGGL